MIFIIDVSDVKTVMELGFIGTAAFVYIKQQQKMFNQQQQTNKALALLEKYLNNSFLKGKALEVTLILKVKEFCTKVEEKAFYYIQHNNLKINWVAISVEIANYFVSEMNEFENQLHDLIEETTYRNIKDLFEAETLDAQQVVLQILEDIKESGAEEDYELGKRHIKAHMESVQARMIQKIQKAIA